MRKSQYQMDLKKQMLEDQARKNKAKNKKLEEDYQALDDFYGYNPFGRGGGGAPLRDQFGNSITTRKPNFRGDYTRQHFKDQMRKGSRLSSRSKKHGKKSKMQKVKRKINEFNNHETSSSDDISEADLIASAPVYNTTANTAATLANNPDFRPDYVVEYEKPKRKPDYVVKTEKAQPPPPPPPQVTYQVVQPQVDWAAWRNELFALLQWERWQREEEEKRRKYQWMVEEEKYNKEREDMERRYQRELEDRRRQHVDIMEENLARMQDYWEHRHDEEYRRWEEMMAHPRYVQYLDRDNSVKLSQAFVDQLGSTMRLELDKVKNNMDSRDLELLQQISQLKKDAGVADRERFDTLAEVDRVRGELENQKALDSIRHKYVYNTLMWDKLMDQNQKNSRTLPKYRQTDGNSKYLIENSVMDSLPNVPDAEKHKMLDVGDIQTQSINARSDAMLSSLNNRESLDDLDNKLFNQGGKKSYKDALTSSSRYGGLKTGEHQINYNTE